MSPIGDGHNCVCTGQCRPASSFVTFGPAPAPSVAPTPSPLVEGLRALLTDWEPHQSTHTTPDVCGIEGHVIDICDVCVEATVWPCPYEGLRDDLAALAAAVPVPTEPAPATNVCEVTGEALRPTLLCFYNHHQHEHRVSVLHRAAPVSLGDEEAAR